MLIVINIASPDAYVLSVAFMLTKYDCYQYCFSLCWFVRMGPIHYWLICSSVLSHIVLTYQPSISWMTLAFTDIVQRPPGMLNVNIVQSFTSLLAYNWLTFSGWGHAWCAFVLPVSNKIHYVLDAISLSKCVWIVLLSL